MFYSKFQELSLQIRLQPNKKKYVDALTLLSFLYHVNVASGFPPDETHSSFCTEPAGII